MELTLGIKLYRAFRFILITLFIAYLFYTKDIWRFYFTPFYFGWYFLPSILKFIDHLKGVGMSPDDYPTSSRNFNNKRYNNENFETNIDNYEDNYDSNYENNYNSNYENNYDSIYEDKMTDEEYAMHIYSSVHPSLNSTSPYTEEEANTIAGL